MTQQQRGAATPLRALAFCAVASLASALCLFTERPGQPPEPANLSLPFPANFTDPIQCPMYRDSGCCNSYQNGVLQSQLSTADLFFGQLKSGGCPACSANLRNFWCAYTCSPAQDQFVQITKYVPGVSLATEMIAEPHYACSVFSSCSGTSIARTLTTMSTCEGFFQYQAQAATIFGVNVEVAFQPAVNVTRNASTPGTGVIPLQGAYYNCCNYPANFSDASYGNTSCPCASCKGMCGIEPCFDGVSSSGGNGSKILPDLGVPVLSVMSGFNVLVVGVFYGALVLVSVAVLGIRRWKRAAP